MPNSITTYQWFAAILRDDALIDTGNCTSEDELWQTGLENGVLVLANNILTSSGALGSISQAFQDKLKKHALNAAATELQQEHELRQMLALFVEAEIPFLLIKGTPLGYSHYSQSYLRSRCDTDMLFATLGDAEQAWHLLKDHGYTRPNAVSGEYVSHEFSCYKNDKLGVGHALDMHWKLSNAQRFARAFTFAELADSPTPITELGEHVHALGPVHALFLACMHRIAHKPEGMENRLIWLFDIHLLTENFDDTQWQQFLSMAKDKGMCGICLDGIQQTMMTFYTDIPEHALGQLEEAASKEKYSTEMGQSRLAMELSNLRALPGWKDRVGLIKERVFPDANYMMLKYDTQKKSLLPYLYVKRAAGGIFKLFLDPKS